MPELPEVETIKRGLKPLIMGQIVSEVHLYRDDLRWQIPSFLVDILPQQQVRQVLRRGKYLLVRFDVGILILHLGMSGSIGIKGADEDLQKHDHFEIVFENGECLRLNDPRRFGCVLFSADGRHILLDKMGVEPLSNDFDDGYLYAKSRGKKQSVKGFVMDGRVVVGVGNIYACEALYFAGISPISGAGSLSKKRYQTLTAVIKKTLNAAIDAGGTTLQDFKNVDGKPGYFANVLAVYGRENASCNKCGGKIRKITQNQRSTFYCPKCQT